MTKNARLSRDIDAIELGFVEREATPQFAMKLGIRYTWLGYRYQIPSQSLVRWVLNVCVQPFITGFIKPIYSPTTIGNRIR
jgi:hypothetical protein